MCVILLLLEILVILNIVCNQTEKSVINEVRSAKLTICPVYTKEARSNLFMNRKTINVVV